MLRVFGPSLMALAAFLSAPVAAQDTRISQSVARFETSVNGQSVVVARNGPACPPTCIQPMQAAAGIATIGELEMLDFLDLFVSAGQGLVVDARLPANYAGATLPGAVNVPAATVRPDNPYRDDLMSALGAQSGDYSRAFDLVVFGDSAADGAPVAALQSLIDAGYPASKLKYYRGGLQSWMGLGLNTVSGP